jgi:hypothetical protein
MHTIAVVHLMVEVQVTRRELVVVISTTLGLSQQLSDYSALLRSLASPRSLVTRSLGVLGK